MPHTRSFLVGAVAGFAAALLAVGYGSCQQNKKTPSETETAGTDPSSGVPGQPEGDLAAPLATVDDVTITVGEFQERINRQSPYIRARYTSKEQKEEFLDTLIRFEILAKEARQRGFDRDPEVVRTMKQVMIQKLMKAEFQDKVKPEDITEEEMMAFYKEHESEYNKPEEVRVSAIILGDKKTAEKVAAEAKGSKGKTNKGFRDLVGQHSVDDGTKMRGGDLRYFGRESTEVARPVVEAAFALTKVGEVAGPIDGKDGKFYIIKQTGKRKAVSKAYEDVKRQIQNRIYRDKRTDSQKRFIDNLKKNAKIVINEENLDKVRIDTSTRGPGHGHGHGAPGFAPDAPDPGPGPR